MDQITLEALFPLSAYAEHRRHAREQGYCDPFVPFVGERYGSGKLPRLVYSGVAAGWQNHECEEGDDLDVRAAGHTANSAFVADGMNGSAYWRLFDAVLAIMDVNNSMAPSERRQHAVWTNLSKTGKVQETAAPDDDLRLRELDAPQFRHEVELLRPDLLLCPSGRSLAATGEVVFRKWPDADLSPSVPETSIKRTPDGGWLYWTMHPQGKTADWTQKVLSDVQAIADRIRAERG